MDFFEFGSRPSAQDGSTLVSPRARRLLKAVRASRDFEVIEFRRRNTGKRVVDIIVVDCTNDQVPSKNRFGIKNRERIGLTVSDQENVAPEARMLRVDFPRLPHVNQVPRGEPNHLCLYQESWTETRRSWTPERFLHRILWWLSQSAIGALHAPDQPVERLYFDFANQLVLPRDHQVSLARRPCRLVVDKSENYSGVWVMHGEFTTLDRYSDLRIATIVIGSDAVIHGRVEEHPTTLGQLDVQLAARGLRLAEQLRLALAFYVVCNPRMLDARMFMLVIDTHLRRAPHQPVEKQETRAFFLHKSSFVQLGEQLGVLQNEERGIEQRPLLSSATHDPTWMGTEIVPVDVRAIPARPAARKASGVDDDGADDQRTLIGVGSLGSALLELWSREAWGMWNIIDPDRVEPHNVVRHIAKAADVGKPKVVTCKELIRATYNDDSVVETIHARALPAESHVQMDAAYARSVLIVDVSTTLSVPRDLSTREDVPRCASAFVTPSGVDAVLLLEDSTRATRLRDLEPQYYANLLSDDWGKAHLSVEAETVRVANGCRDASAVMSLEQIQLFSAILAKQIRVLSRTGEAHILMWRSNSDGGVETRRARVTTPYRDTTYRWSVVSSEGVDDKMRVLRDAKLPRETGGVIVGYIDHQTNTIYVVDVMPAPPDSIEEKTHFIRGKEGVEAALEEVGRRTMKAVRYIGEWHSHPPRVSASPSGDDLLLGVHMATALSSDGDPALMIIVGDTRSKYVLTDATARI